MAPSGWPRNKIGTIARVGSTTGLPAAHSSRDGMTPNARTSAPREAATCSSNSSASSNVNKIAAAWTEVPACSDASAPSRSRVSSGCASPDRASAWAGPCGRSIGALSTSVNSAERRISSVRRVTSDSRFLLSASSLDMVSRSCAAMRLNDSASRPSSSLDPTLISTSRLPARISSAPRARARIGSEMRPAIKSAASAPRNSRPAARYTPVASTSASCSRAGVSDRPTRASPTTSRRGGAPPGSEEAATAAGRALVTIGAHRSSYDSAAKRIGGASGSCIIGPSAFIGGPGGEPSAGAEKRKISLPAVS